MRALELQFANVSVRDLALGPEALRQFEDSLGVQFLSANIQVGGKPWFRPYALLRRSVGGQELGIGVTAVTMSARGATDAWPDSIRPTIADPVESAQQMLELLASQSDLQILLAYLPASELQELGEKLQGYDLLVGGAGDLLEAPSKGSLPVALSPGTKCKFLGWVAIRPGAAESLVVTAAGVEQLDEKVRDDGEMAKQVKELKQRLGQGVPVAAEAPGTEAHPRAAATPLPPKADDAGRTPR